MAPNLDEIMQKTVQLDEAVDALIHRGQRTSAPLRPDKNWQPVFDVYQHHGFHYLDIELPGIPPQEVAVEIVGGTKLLITGRRPAPPNEPDLEAFYTQRVFGPFRLELPLPQGQVAQTLEQRHENGMLHLKITLGDRPLPQLPG